LAHEDDEQIQVQAPIVNANNNDDNNNNNQRQQRGHNGPLNDEAADHYFFGELKDVYQAERLRNNNNDENDNDIWFERRAERVIDTVMAEVTLFQDEPSLPLQDDDRKFSCPLQWWKNYQKNLMHSCHFSAFRTRLFCCRLDNCQGPFKFGPAYRT
jgi:hypothetical protein